MAAPGLRRRISGSQAARAGLCFAALIVVAEGAVLLLAPSEEGIPPEAGRRERRTSIPPRSSGPSDFRDGQRLLLVGGLAAQALVIGALAVGRPRAARDLLGRLSGRGAFWAPRRAGVCVVVVAEARGVPDDTRRARAIRRRRPLDPVARPVARRPGKGPGDRRDRRRAPALPRSRALIRRSPRRWWIPGSIVVVGYGAVMSLLAPILIAPRFNDFDKLPESSDLRADVVELGDRAGVDVGVVYRVDASRRSTALNAYVAGIGPTKRVVLYDTLIDGDDGARAALGRRPRARPRCPLRHSRGASCSPRSSLRLASCSSASSSGAMARRSGAEPGSAAAVPALFLAIAVVSFAVNVPANQLSRKVEASADAFALRITDDPQGLEDLQMRLAERNLSDVDPPGWAIALFGTHPTTLERIGSARAWEQGER